MARPEKQEEERQSARLNVRLTPAQRESIAAAAKTAGLSDSEYGRRRLTEHRVMAALDQRALAALVSELNRIGVNMNQIAHAANIGRTLEGKLEDALGELHGVLGRAARALEV